ncbi:MAG: 7TM diverse intracellular signaling domain-containing protein [Salibacteraceae bacterium]
MTRFLIILTTLTALTFQAWSNVPEGEANLVKLSSDTGIANLGTSLYYYISNDDDPCDRNLNCIQSKAHDAFMPHLKKNVNFGLDDRTHWFYFDVLDVSQPEQSFYLVSTYPLIDSLTVFAVQSEKVKTLAETGDMMPFSEREVLHRNFVIPLKIEKQVPARIFIKLSTKSSIQMNLSIQAEKQFAQNSLPFELVFGIYFGLILIMSLYNFFIYLSLKESSYVYYSLSTISAGFVYAILNGYAFQYIWPNAANFNQVSISYAMCFTGIFSILFSIKFLQLGAYSKLLKTISWILILICILTALFTLVFGYLLYAFYIPVLTVMLGLGAMVMLISGIYCWYKGNRSARLFIAAWAAYLLGTILLILRNLGILPGNEITSSSAMIGQAVEVVLLSFALADKYRIIRQEKDRAQEDRLRIQESYAHELEEEVKDRTENLAKANDELNKSFNELSIKNRIISKKNQEITDSIQYAKRIQSAILPSDRLFQSRLPKSFVLYKPKDIVAGDFYWLESYAKASDSEGGVVLFAAADCTGHGVPGAMVSVVCSNAMNRAVREFGLTNPGEVLDKTRALVIQEFEKSDEDVKDGMDISLCALSLSTLTLKWAGANNPLWIARKGATEMEEIKGDKQPIGKFHHESPFTTHQLKLNEGDTIYIFSDGFPDQFGGENGKKYKSGKFKHKLVELAKEPIEKQKDLLDHEFESWRGDLDQLDDVCVIGVHIL